MSRVITGEYLVQFYDEYGAKLKSLTTTAFSLAQAQELGEVRLADDGVKSFTVDRRIHNSLDPKHKI